MAAAVERPSLTLDLDTLPGGEACLFEVVASSGMRTETAQTDVFALDVHPRRAYIVSPNSGAKFSEQEPVPLFGTGYSPDFGTAEIGDVAWTSNVDGFLGFGYELLPHTLSRGVHMISLTIADGSGGETSDAVRILVGRR